MRDAKIKSMNTPEYKEKVRNERLSRNDNPEYIKKLSDASRRNWESVEYSNKVKKGIKEYFDNETEEDKLKRINLIKNSWDDSLRIQQSELIKSKQSKEILDNKSKFLKEQWKNLEWRSDILNKRNKTLRSDEYSKKRSKITKKLWEDTEYRNKVEPKVTSSLLKNRANWPNSISYPEKIAKDILDELNISYEYQFYIKKNSKIEGHCYFLDFKIGNIVLEIDGPQHYDELGNLLKCDIIRDDYLNDQFNIKTHRIKWTGNSIYEINQFKNNILNFIKENL